MATALLCRHPGESLVGATYDHAAGQVLVTVQGDGVTAYDLEQRQGGSIPLGSRSELEFQTASAQHTIPAIGRDQPRRSLVASVVHDKASKGYTLFCHELSSGASAKRTIADATSRVPVPGPAHSVHILHRQPSSETASNGASSSSDALRIAVVLNDGRIGVTDTAAAESSAPLALLSAPGQASLPRALLAVSSGDTLVVLTQQTAGAGAALRVLRLSATDISPARSISLPCPGAPSTSAHAVPTGLTLSAAFALVQWSNGHATAVHGIQGGVAAGPLRPNTFPLADAVGSNGASSSAPAAGGATPGRKRKNAAGDGAAGGAASRPRVLCAAVDDRQFVVLDLESAAAQSQICYSLHDAQFGCPLSSGTMDVDAPLLSLDPAACAVVGSSVGPDGAAVLRLGTAVHVLTLRTQPVSLLSLVARLSVSAAAAPGQGGKAAGAAAAVRGVAAELSALPAPVSLDPALLAGDTTTAAAASAVASMGDDAADVMLAPVPSSAVSRVDDICNSLVEQLSSALAAAAAGTKASPPQALLDSAVSYISGRRQHAMAVPPQLLSLAARGLTAARQWSQLGGLLAHVPPGGLSGCSDVLAAAATAAQYGLLPRLCTCLDEVEPGALVGTLAALLAPTTRTNLEARQQHYAALRSSAEARVAEAELAACGGPSIGAPAATRGRGRALAAAAAAAADTTHALALAQCAAAAVDGWSYREVLLHPLLALPVDAPAVQVALRGLAAPAVDALLSYCAKWVAKYAGGVLGEMASAVVLPQELLFPYYQQVLEWTRMTIDAHLARLLMARTPHPALESLEKVLGGAVEGARRLMLLRGALEHMAAAAPLPAAHMAVATQYTAEVLDLRVR